MNHSELEIMHIACRNDEKQHTRARLSLPWVRILRLQYFEYFMPARGGREYSMETQMFDGCSGASFLRPFLDFSCFSGCHIAVDGNVNVNVCRRLTLMQFSSAHDVLLDVNVMSAFDGCLLRRNRSGRISRRRSRRSSRIRIQCAQLAME